MPLRLHVGRDAGNGGVIDDILPGYRSVMIFSKSTEKASAPNHQLSASQEMDSFISLKAESLKNFFLPQGKSELTIA